MKLQGSDIRKMLEVAQVAARLAGQRAMEEIKYTKATIKNNSEIVTQADAACQKVIIDHIKETYPDHGFIAEEGSEGQLLKQPPRSTDPIWWVIDPIDGTNNYAHGLLNFAVSIAVIADGQPIVAAIYDPATDSMFTAAKDCDAQLNASRINVSDEEISEYASFGVDSHFNDAMAPAIHQIIKTLRFRCLGTTALHLAYTAKGSMLGAITTIAKLWDIAAGILIIQTAGGIVTDITGKDILPFDPENYTGQNYNILTANKKTHKQFLEMFNN